MNSLRTVQIEKSYKGRQVVRDVSFHVNASEIVGLLGPNGAGKTTSFYITLGLVKAEFGKIYLNDVDITELPMHQRARLGIGYLPQEASIFRKLTVADNIMAILQLNKNLSNSDRRERLKSLMQELNVAHLSNIEGISLSGGERRRVEIARALAMDPLFILLDEPFAGIDPISIIDIKRIIKHLTAKGIGILITDHNVRETLDICERAYIVSQGSIIAEGTPQQILKHTIVREVYLGDEFDL
ncbi:MAG TPA: LPS export ABC transporter ATP-binding protein [Coxiellaceae bacterium]|nr:LPS export ABC transporter ATP-binding protein [Coxiellaceae bacterium]